MKEAAHLFSNNSHNEGILSGILSLLFSAGKQKRGVKKLNTANASILTHNTAKLPQTTMIFSTDVRYQWKIPWHNICSRKWSCITVLVSLLYIVITISLNDVEVNESSQKLVFTEEENEMNNAITLNVDNNYANKESAPKRKDGNSYGNSRFQKGSKNDNVTTTYRSRSEVLQHKRLIDIIMYKDSTQKEKDDISDGNKIGRFRRGITVDNGTITYHSGVNEVIWKWIHSKVYGTEFRHNTSQRITWKLGWNKQYKKCLVRFRDDTNNAYNGQEELEQDYIARQPGMDLDNNPRRFFIFYKCSYWLTQHWRLVQQIRVLFFIFIFTNGYRLRSAISTSRHQQLSQQQMSSRESRSTLALKQSVFRWFIKTIKNYRNLYISGNNESQAHAAPLRQITNEEIELNE